MSWLVTVREKANEIKKNLGKHPNKIISDRALLRAQHCSHACAPAQPVLREVPASEASGPVSRRQERQPHQVPAARYLTEKKGLRPPFLFSLVISEPPKK